MNYGQTIKDLRVNKFKESQMVFAERIGITQTYLCQLERNNKKPSIDLLENISDSVKIPMPILFWKSLTEDQVPIEKKEFFNIVKPHIDALIMEVF